MCNELDFKMHKHFSDILIVLRDTKERGRDIENILHQYTTLVKPAFEEFCLPVSCSSFPEYQTYLLIYWCKVELHVNDLNVDLIYMNINSYIIYSILEKHIEQYDLAVRQHV